MMKVSCVIPVYNVERYLRQCVESLTQQTYRDIEVILVDDGSPDGSPQLCDELAGEDSRIRVIHKENGGLSDARNAGLMEATGDYVVFVDGDDFWIRKDAMRQLVDCLKPEVDFLGYNCMYYYPSSEKFSPWVPYSEVLSKQSDKNTAMIELVKSGTFPMSACLKLIKRSFLIDNQLFFKKGQLSEDIPWFINMLDATEKCCFVNNYVYAYRQNVSGSITNSSGKRHFVNIYEIFKYELCHVDCRSFCDEAKDALKSFLAYEYCIMLGNLKVFEKEERKVMRKELYSQRNVLDYDMNPKVKKASLINRLIGIRTTELVLKIYQFVRKRRK